VTNQEGFSGGRDLRMMNEISGNIRPSVLKEDSISCFQDMC
jgi:hypothetical protein